MTEREHRPVLCVIDEQSRHAVASAQWLLEAKTQGVQSDNVIDNDSHIEVFIGGEETFKKIAQDIEKAKASIDIICWGFDPGMELIRTGKVWPRGECFGDLLTAAAKRNVTVRILAWYSSLGNILFHNLPQYSGRTSDEKAPQHSDGYSWYNDAKIADPTQAHSDYNVLWFRQAKANAFPGIHFRTRAVDSDAAEQSLADEHIDTGFVEKRGFTWFSSHHQKSILIDYAHEGGCDAVGYVIGLNSVTDFWDTNHHHFNDELRGQQYEGNNDGSGEPTLKSYQDYACRLRGGALVAVHRNFVRGWNSAEARFGDSGKLTEQKMPDLSKGIAYPRHRAQILRTEPNDGVLAGPEKSIKAIYYHAIEWAMRYIYVENQYFQDADWVKALRESRQRYLKAYADSPKDEHVPAQPDELHLFVVTPTPEFKRMVPRTHDAVSALGEGNSMPNQQQSMDDEIRAHEKATADFEVFPKPNLSKLAQRHLAYKTSTQELKDSYGLNALVASLWSYNEHWHEPPPPGTKPRKNRSRYREIYIHSKLMIIDDGFFTLGSANLNIRSFTVDSELNIASDETSIARPLRKEVWAMNSSGNGKSPSTTYSGGEGTAAEVAAAHKNWKKLAAANLYEKENGRPLQGHLVAFHDTRSSSLFEIG